METESERWSGLEVEEASIGDALERMRERPETLDVVVTESHLVSVLVDTAAHVAGSRSSVAQAWLPDEGPGLFVPGASDSEDVAGLGTFSTYAALYFDCIYCECATATWPLEWELRPRFPTPEQIRDELRSAATVFGDAH